jgi:hypothetical protein
MIKFFVQTPSNISGALDAGSFVGCRAGRSVASLGLTLVLLALARKGAFR